MVFKKKTSKPLKPLYEQIERDHLGNMPVYRDTLFRGGNYWLIMENSVAGVEICDI